MRTLFFLTVIFSFSALMGVERPESIDPAVWEQLVPYLLPDDHPLKATLDTIFAEAPGRLIESQSQLESAGFYPYGEHHTSGIHVMAHVKLKNWLIKAFTEDNPRLEWQNFLYRCQRGRGGASGHSEKKSSTLFCRS